MLQSRRAIGYPTNRLVAVIDDPAEAAAALAELKAEGFVERDLDLLRGEEGADRIDGTGDVSGWLGRLRRLRFRADGPARRFCRVRAGIA